MKTTIASHLVRRLRELDVQEGFGISSCLAASMSWASQSM
jgi:hypothetical protein